MSSNSDFPKQHNRSQQSWSRPPIIALIVGVLLAGVTIAVWASHPERFQEAWNWIRPPKDPNAPVVQIAKNEPPAGDDLKKVQEAEKQAADQKAAEADRLTKELAVREQALKEQEARQLEIDRLNNEKKLAEANVARVKREVAAAKDAEERKKQEAELKAALDKLEREAKERERLEQEHKRLQAQIDAAEAKRKADEEEFKRREAKRVADEQRIEEERKRRDAEALAKLHPLENYKGPRSGTFTWEGDVRGTRLINVTNGRPDSGRFVSEPPPVGVPLVFEPENRDKVGIASSPGTADNFTSFVMRAKGDGRTRVVVQWSVP